MEMEVVSLSPGVEYRFRITTDPGEDTVCDVRAVKGTAEVFGSALVPKEDYVFEIGSYAVFTWYGCTLEVNKARLVKPYTCSKDDSSMNIFAGVHGNLELLRDQSYQRSKGGPRIAVVGPESSGKTTVSRILSSYSVRGDRTPIYLDIDPRNNHLCVPGTLAATVLNNAAIDPVLGVRSASPIVYFTGYAKPQDCPDQFTENLEALVLAVERRVLKEKQSFTSGMIIDTFPSSDASYDLLKAALTACRVDIILVLGQDRLFNELKSDFAEPNPGDTKKSPVQVIKLPQSGAVGLQDVEQVKSLQARSIKRYFEGTKAMPLAPTHKVVKLEELKLFKVHNRIRPDSGILPVGHESTLDEDCCTQITSLDPSLIHKVLAISFAQSDKELQEANPELRKNVAGLVYVESIDTDAGTLNLVVPSNQPFPTQYLLKGDIEWIDV